MQKNLYFKSEVGWVKVTLVARSITELCFTTQGSDGFTETQNQDLVAIIKFQLQEYFEGKRKIFTLPFHIQGTAFQQQVWKAVQAIEYGETASYLEIAQKIGRPEAVRAVAQAIAHNKIALLIPCHRIIRSTGESGGYAWGKSIKRGLLGIESRSNYI